MALTETLDSSSSSKPSPNPNPNPARKRKWKKKSNSNLADSTQPRQPPPPTSSSPVRRRTKCPGVRIRGGRIFDSENGKTCHQCRQKTMDAIAACKGQRGDKPCTIKFCQKCLLNRYGEKVEENNQIDDWKCPKCRGICNCSFCMKKKGHQPTGIMVHAAKATGFQSVFEMMTIAGPENLCALRKKIRASKEMVSDGRDDSCPDRKPLKLVTDATKISELERKNSDNTVERRMNGGTQPKKRRKKTCLPGEIDLNIGINEEETMSRKVDDGGKLRKNSDKRIVRRKNAGTQINKRKKKGCLASVIDLNVSVNEEEAKSEAVDGGDKLRKSSDMVIEGRKNDGAQSKQEKKKVCLANEIDLNVSVYEEEMVSDMVDHSEKLLKITKTYLTTMAREEKCSNIWGSCVQLENNTEEPYNSSQTRLVFENAENKIDEEHRSLIACKNGQNCSLGDQTNLAANCKNTLTYDADISRDFSLPTQSDMELPAEDVLQFLEFCNAFGEELLSKKVPETKLLEPACAPLEILATFCNFVHTS